MRPGYDSVGELRESLHWLLSISASLAGFCVAGIGLLNAKGLSNQYSGLGDDGLAVSAVCFLFCTYLCFWALRTRFPKRQALLAMIVDTVFLSGLTIVVACGIGITYALI